MTIPTFNLQIHHNKVEVPGDFDFKDLSKKYGIFPLKAIQVNGRNRLLLAMRNPFDTNAILDAEFRAGMPVIAVQATASDIDWLVQVHYFGRKLTPTANVADFDTMYDDVFEQVSKIKELESN